MLAYKVKRCLLRELLRKADMEQRELADLLNVTVQQINKYVLDKQNMSIQVAKNIAFILNCTIDELYEWEWVDLEVGKNE
ncbi:helix-turn-helix domain-containing protein (plasmid) [Lysinibacillus capsici]|uniref:helix-turn-helix transcriptional regulator n=1 Tax=Lysinibacillus capsici TaxID=2115968 RepID=UPI0021D9362C|nr:helix-turn-helix transcriptional regulator [Lysinibacillus capsici]UYB50140.1 helix-turn-helix domain-containing protein [Lysinibacillus capsici]UYB50214.1 helix-turn-helix domain-containing protein [Lysinibacillus capsici]